MMSLEDDVRKAEERSKRVTRDADYSCRLTNVELRELKLALEDNYKEVGEFIEEADRDVEKAAASQRKWIDKQVDIAKTMADQALHSVLLTNDVQCLERKADVLKDSMTRASRMLYEYTNEMDLKKLTKHVEGVVIATERREKVALCGIKTDEPTLAIMFRGCIEQLLAVKSTHPKIMAEAKKLAADLKIYRDAAENGNFHEMVAKCSEYSTVTGSSTSVNTELSVETKISADGRPRGERIRDYVPDQSPVSITSADSLTSTRRSSSTDSTSFSSSSSSTSSSATATLHASSESSIDSYLSDTMSPSSNTSGSSKSSRVLGYGLSEVGSLSPCIPTRPMSAPSSTDSYVFTTSSAKSPISLSTDSTPVNSSTTSTSTSTNQASPLSSASYMSSPSSTKSSSSAFDTSFDTSISSLERRPLRESKKSATIPKHYFNPP